MDDSPPIRVFLSHSKHDRYGEATAVDIRRWLHEHSQLDGFVDKFDVRLGSVVEKTLSIRLADSAFVAIHTDSYSSRPWCRREVVEAKMLHVPVIVVDCLHGHADRGFPYLGNVPVIRMPSTRPRRVGAVIDCLLEEVFRTYLWDCRVENFRQADPDILFVSRAPELLSLATFASPGNFANRRIVYPDPMLGPEESRLFMRVAPDVRLQTLTEWLRDPS